jgi:probable biosynthetic protein (TIGR04098 family)
MFDIKDILKNTAASADFVRSDTEKTGEPLGPFAPFRLGMPHMSAEGASRSWLLREACHTHWTAISARLGVNPTEFRDRKGARVLASVVACTLRGHAAQFREDESCQLFLREAPSAENGWRSEIELRSTQGHSLRAEILTAFSRRAGASNTGLEPAELEDQFSAHQDGEAARRASVIRRLGNSDRILATHLQDRPQQVVAIDPVKHVNGVGLVDFAEIHDILASAERKALPELVRVWPMQNRRVHFFGNLDPDDALEITSHSTAQALSPQGSVVVQSHAKRASDGVVIATAESVYSF